MTRKSHGRKALGQITSHYSQKRRGSAVNKQPTGGWQARLPVSVNECVTCGEPGASLRADGQMYHNHCWMQFKAERE